MVIYYTEDKLNTIFNDPTFLCHYRNYIEVNDDKINNLKDFINSLDINHTYYKLNISKNKKYLSNDTICIKKINNLLNKVTDDNINIIIKEIIVCINDEIYPLILNNIIDKCISQIKYNDLYIHILKELLKKRKKNDIEKIINKKIKLIYNEKRENINDYQYLCELNKNIDDSIGLSSLIIKLEKNNIINGYIDNIIEKIYYSININIDNEDICYKYIISIYNVFKILDKSYIDAYKGNLEDLMNKNISKKNKFKLMDILDML